MDLPEDMTVHRTATWSWIFVAMLVFARPASHAQAVPRPSRLGTGADAGVRYALRAGDTVTISYRLTPEFNQTATIQPDGFLSLPLVGEVHVAGMTLEAVKALVVEKASAHLKEPEVTVALKEFERPYVVVAGEVPHPGKLDFYEKTTALQAIFLAGGFEASAQQSDVYLFRKINGELAEVHTLNLKGIKRTGDLSSDLVLQPGDMILVPRNKLEHVGRFLKLTNLSVYFDPIADLR
jgi:polysaccharide export outer membrane protein